jgi:hypothetical protein
MITYLVRTMLLQHALNIFRLRYKIGQYNFEHKKNTKLQRRAAKTVTFCCYKRCTLTVIKERDYINADNNNCVLNVK